MSGQAEDQACSVVDFCLPFASPVGSFQMCAYPEASRSSVGAAYASCVTAAIGGACQTTCAGALHTDMGNPCGNCARDACASVRANCF